MNSSSTVHETVSRLFYSQKRCQPGDWLDLKHGHGVDPQSTPKETPLDEIPRNCSPNPASSATSNAHIGPEHEDVQKLDSDLEKQTLASSSHPMSPVAGEGATTSLAVTGSCTKHSQHARRAEAAARERVDAIVKQEAAKAIGEVNYIRRKVADEAVVRGLSEEEAAMTINQLVFGSIVTYSAGLDVSSLITGFETCAIRFANHLPDVNLKDDIHTLLRDHGINVENLHLVVKEGWNRGPEVHILTDIISGQAIAVALDGVEFRDEPLVIEMSATNSLDGMDATAGEGSDILTISWHAPSARYVAEYVDVPAAKAKVSELNRFIYRGRRIRVEMNSHPPGYFIPNLRLNAIKIHNLPPDVTDEDVIKFAKSQSAKRLRIKGTFTGAYTIEQVARLVKNDIEQAVPEGFLRFENPPSTCNLDGTVSARAHFVSWDEAHAAHTRLSGQRYGQQAIWLRLPDPMHYTLVIPMEQYRAQKAQWESLLESTKDRQACMLHIYESGNVVRVQLSGSVKESTGAMKVRIENLARGKKVEGWHQLLGIPGNPFVTHRVYSETGAYLRADWQRQTLKVYGAPKAVGKAREMIKNELDRLASLDYTTVLPQTSVGFFVREGIQQLKETLGEDNVKFVMSSRHITVSGGEEARHALDCLLMLALNGKPAVLNARRDNQTCPVCYDDISSPHQLGCGHTYCVACLRHYISSALESNEFPLLCLGDEARCRVPVAIPTIQHFVPPATFNRLLEVAFDAYLAKHPEEFKHCKTPDCMQIYRAARANATPQTLHCPSCFSTVCNACHEDAHNGLTCAQSRISRHPLEQAQVDDWIASQGGRIKKCPQCAVPVEKMGGCNHVICRCGVHICWHCLGIYTRQMIYVHMNEAHGNIYSQDAEAQERQAAVQYQQQEEQERQAAERRQQQAAEWRLQQEAEEQERRRAEQQRQQLEVEEQHQRHEAEEQERQRAEQHQREVEEQRQRHEAEEQERQRMEQRRLQQETEEQKRQAEAQRQQEAQEQERRDREQRQRQEAEEQERRRAEQQRQQRETEEQERRAVEQRQRETEEQERRHKQQVAAEQERRRTEQKRQQEAEERERRHRELHQQQAAAEQERLRVEQLLQQQMEGQARLAAEQHRQREAWSAQEQHVQQAEQRRLRAEEWDRRLRAQRDEMEERLRAKNEQAGCGCGCAIM